MEIQKNMVEFEYHTPAAEQFFKDITKLYKSNCPYFTYEDYLLEFMEKRNKPYFTLNPSHSNDGRHHTFYFKIELVPENKRVKKYVYLGKDLEYLPNNA